MIKLETTTAADSDSQEELRIVELDAAFLPIIGLNFVVPLTFRVCEAWANAVMSQLFDQLLAKNEIT